MDRTYTLTQIESPDWLELKAEGDFTEENFLPYWEDVAERCTESGRTQLLLWCGKTTGRFSTSYIYRFAESIAANPHLRAMKIAFLEENASAQTVEDMEFAENATRNRGLNMMMFFERPKAEAWLHA
jgi:hypothetical protein